MTDNQLPSASALRLLVAYAHPDDESFGLGGTIAHYAGRGVDVHLICATNGDAGMADPEHLAGYATMADLRLRELACAAEKLGIRRVHTFGYRDSGMMGTPDNDHPESLWQAEEGRLVGQVVAVIRQVRPQVVVTFDPYGGYGHPDHIAMHRATLQAFHKAGDPTQYPEQIAAGLAAYQPQKLYYDTFPRGMIRVSVLLARLMGRDPRRMGRNQDVDFQAVLDATLPVHTRVDVRDQYDTWQEASACHASQQGPGSMFPLPRFVLKWLFGWQAFYRAWPEANGTDVIERDLFAGVIAD